MADSAAARVAAPATSSGLGAWTQNGPTMYQSGRGIDDMAGGGAGRGRALIIALGLLAWRNRPLGEAQVVALVTATVLAVPFFLPQMHERYFYLADVMTIVAAFYLRRFWPVAVVVSASSLLAYAPFLWRTTPVSLPLVSFLEFLAVIVTLVVAAHVLTTPESQLIRRSNRTVPGNAGSDPMPAVPAGANPVSPSSDHPAERPPSRA